MDVYLEIILKRLNLDRIGVSSIPQSSRFEATLTSLRLLQPLFTERILGSHGNHPASNRPQEVPVEFLLPAPLLGFQRQ